LTISIFAQTLQVPEHQLRRTINAGLGYRNFNAFLNHFRIGEIKTVLADPARARTPILTLAMDVGYGSLAPFNRAFKELVGLTPSAYRKLKLGTADEGGTAVRSPSPQN
jgi:AraC-like DNA-binding protein